MADFNGLMGRATKKTADVSFAKRTFVHAQPHMIEAAEDAARIATAPGSHPVVGGALGQIVALVRGGFDVSGLNLAMPAPTRNNDNVTPIAGFNPQHTNG